MEILVVITIIGILSAIAVPSYIHAVDQGRRDACAANVQILITQVERYRLVEGKPVVLDGRSLVEFLTGIGYLSGQSIVCPYAALGEDCEYVLVLQGGLQTVECTHCREEIQDGE